MSQPMDRQRLRNLLITGGITLVMLVAATLSLAAGARRSWQPDVSGPVLAHWGEIVAAARQIEITAPEDHFTIERNGDSWVMPSRDGHPVIPARLAELDAFFGDLAYVGARTADPAKHARLELADPGQPGGGTRITIRAADDRVLADLILGASRRDLVYLRFPGRDRTFAAELATSRGATPDLALADNWLDLDFIALDQGDIARTTIAPETGPAYVLERAGRAQRNFSLREPGGWRPITAGAGNGPASALSRIRFRDVRRAERLRGEQVGRHVEETFSGLRLTFTILALGDTRWAIIEARALTDGSRDAAAAINARSEGWAYLLSDLSVDRLLRPLAEIADFTGGSDAAEPDNDTSQ